MSRLKFSILSLLVMILGVSISAHAATSRIAEVPHKKAADKNTITPFMEVGEMGLVAEKDIFINIDDLKDLTKEEFIKNSGLFAFYSLTGNEADYYFEYANEPDGLKALLEKITIDDNAFEKLKNTKEIGNVVLRVNYYNKLVDSIGYDANDYLDLPINIVNSESVYNEDLSTSPAAVLYAANFEYNLSDVNDLDLSKVISLSKSKAWDASINAFELDGYSVEPGKDLTPIIKADQSQLDTIKSTKVAGVYPLDLSVTYYLGYSITKKINVTVNNNYDYTILAENFSILNADVELLTNEQALKLANVKVVDNFGNDLSSSAIINLDNLKTLSNTILKDTVVNDVEITYTDSSNKAVSTKINVTLTVDSGDIEKKVDPQPGPTDPNPNPSDDNEEKDALNKLPKTGANMSMIFSSLSVLAVSAFALIRRRSN